MTHHHVHPMRLGASAFKRRGVDADIVGTVPRRTKRPPIGRPVERGENASIRIALRLTPSEHASYLAAANAAGVSLGEWLRSAAEARLAAKRKRG